MQVVYCRHPNHHLIIMYRLILCPLVFAMSSSALATESLPTYQIVARDGLLQPARLEVPAGKRIKLAISNQGKAPIEFENLQMHVEKVLGPGGNSFVVLNPLKPGSYRFIDEFHPQTGKLDLVAR